MNRDLDAAWQHAADTGEPVDIGNIVVCDSCSEDYTESDYPGGLLFGSKAICPRCVPDWEKRIAEYDEQHWIRARAGHGEPFRAFVLRMRGGHNTIQIRGGLIGGFAD